MYFRLKICFCVIVLLAILDGCSTSYKIVSQEELSNYPCLESKNGVNIRIRNTGNITFSKFSVLCEGKEMFFPGLKRGEVSCYKNMPYVWSNNSYGVFFSKQKGYVKTLMLRPADHLGESKVDQGYLTIDIIVSESNKRITANTKIVIEK
jgi:hypothetical protein